MVKKQVHMMLSVPRPVGSPTQPAAKVSAVVALRFIIRNQKSASIPALFGANLLVSRSLWAQCSICKIRSLSSCRVLFYKETIFVISINHGLF